jgi:drug/metabolite transporter (DMT)-like permease
MSRIDWGMKSTGASIARATSMIVISACCFGSLTTLTLLATRAGLSLMNVILWRFVLAAMVLFVMTIRTRRAHEFGKTELQLMLIGATAQALISYLSFRALDYLPVGILAFLFYTYPAWVAAISAATGRESLTRTRLIALVLAMAGIAVMVETPAAHLLNTTGICLALGTAFLYALYLPALHSAQRQLPPLVSTFYLVSGIALSFLIVATATQNLVLPGTLELWSYLLLLSIIGTVVAFGTMIAGLRVLGPVRTSIVSTVEPFFTAVLGALVLAERLTVAALAGGAMIASAVIFLERSSERAEARGQ